MKKALLLLFGLAVLLHAYTYHHRLLQIYAKIAPRIVLMTRGPMAVSNGSLLICIRYEAGDEAAARQLKTMMLEAYPEGLQSYPLEIGLIPYGQPVAHRNVALIFLLDADPALIKPTIDYATAHHVPTMSYDSRFLKDGVLFSLDIGTTVRPVINMEQAKRSGIIMDDLLLQISKIYKGGEQL